MRGLGVPAITAGKFGSHFDFALNKFQVYDRDVIAIMLANCIVESEYFTRLREGMFYTTTKALFAAFGSKRFAGVKPEDYLRNPRKLGTFVYNGRNGNRPGTEDGYSYRGGGPMQTTGLSQYRQLNAVLDGKYDVVKNPDDITQPRVGAVSVVYYFMMNGLDKTLKQGGSKGPMWVCNRINKGDKLKPALKLDERLNHYTHALQLLADYENPYVSTKKEVQEVTKQNAGQREDQKA